MLTVMKWILLISMTVVGYGAETLMIDYQNITYDASSERLSIGVQYTGQCSHFLVQCFSLNQVQGELIPEREDLISATSSLVTLNRSELILPDAERAYVRVVATDENSTICSDFHSRETFYQFQRIGMPTWEVQQYGTLELPIPVDFDCGNNHLLFMWPQKLNDSGSTCVCVPLRANHDFDACAEYCGSEYDVHMQDDSIVFRNFTSTADEVMLHFFCEDDLCNDRSCLVVSMASSYKIEILKDTMTATTTDTDLLIIYRYSLVAALAVIIVLLNLLTILVVCFCCKCRNTAREVKQDGKEDAELPLRGDRGNVDDSSPMNSFQPLLLKAIPRGREDDTDCPHPFLVKSRVLEDGTDCLHPMQSVGPRGLEDGTDCTHLMQSVGHRELEDGTDSPHPMQPVGPRGLEDGNCTHPMQSVEDDTDYPYRIQPVEPRGLEDGTYTHPIQSVEDDIDYPYQMQSVGPRSHEDGNYAHPMQSVGPRGPEDGMDYNLHQAIEPVKPTDYSHPIMQSVTLSPPKIAVCRSFGSDVDTD